ncbi:MAG: flagellar hook-associated protein FlgL [Planctomycetes bacterium]|nr:flagellar hook-associated protein FlgL [Planctomycetota bacterium]
MTTWNNIYTNATYAITNQLQIITRLQEQLSTGSRLIRPSDNPPDANAVMSVGSEISDIGTYKKNLGTVRTEVESAASALQSMSNLTIRSKQLLMQGSSGTYNQQNMVGIGNEIDQLLNQAVSLGNQQLLDRYLFSGQTVKVEPYQTMEDAQGRITRATYSGSLSDMPAPVGPGISYSGVAVGQKVFQGSDRQDPVFRGNTGAAAGTGTSSIEGYAWLSAGSATAYDSGTNTTGIVGSRQFTAGDTLTGTHTLTLVAAGTNGGTLQLDVGTAAVAFSGTESYVQVFGSSAGQYVYVDVRGYNTTLAGAYSIDLQRTLGLSIDEGYTYTAIPEWPISDPGNANVAVEDGYTGKILYVDARNVTGEGITEVSVSGTHNIFETLIHIRDLMLNKYDMPEAQQKELLGWAMDALNEAQQTMTDYMTIQGGQIQAMDTLDGRLDELKINYQSDQDKLESADISLLAADLARSQTLYQMTLAATAKLVSMSLLDYL